MKFFYALLLFVLVNSAFTQQNIIPITGTELLYSNDYYYQKNQIEKESLKNNKVQSRTILKYTGDKKNKTVETYDEFGNILTYNQFNKKGENTVSNTYSYDEHQRPVYYKFKNGKKESWMRVEFDASGLLKKSRGYNYKGDFLGREEFLREDGKMLSTTIWDKDSITPFKRLDYEYHEGGSLKSIRYFYKSKLKYTWSYECKSEGELVDETNNQMSTICVKEERDEKGNRIVWQQQFNSKGQLTKTKNVYENDSVLVLSEYYDMDGKLRSQNTFFKDGGQLYFSFTKTGKVYYSSETIYNTKKQLVKRSSSHKKSTSNFWYSYQDDLLTSTLFMNKSTSYVLEYSYTFFEN